MRIIEPKSAIEKKSAKSRSIIVISITFIVFAGSLGAWFVLNKSSNKESNSSETLSVKSDNFMNESQNVVSEETKNTGEFRVFSGNEYRLLYDNLLQPNLERVTLPPQITGDDIADARIRSLAELRGYKLRSSPVGILSSEVDGYPAQLPVVSAWNDMQAAGAREGHTMSVVSAYRSVEEQRALFLSRLEATGTTVDDIVAGTVDELITSVLVTSAIPGYSKHHTGYTIDLQCAGYVFEQFVESPCYGWMSANNYENAKKFGFIPSYPKDADLQGPDPEAWEYVWVGLEVLQN